jgi:hypothetical protein
LADSVNANSSIGYRGSRLTVTAQSIRAVLRNIDL